MNLADYPKPKVDVVPAMVLDSVDLVASRMEVGPNRLLLMDVEVHSRRRQRNSLVATIPLVVLRKALAPDPPTPIVRSVTIVSQKPHPSFHRVLIQRDGVTLGLASTIKPR